MDGLDETGEEGGVVEARPPPTRVTPHIVHLPVRNSKRHSQLTFNKDLRKILTFRTQNP
jgi:hypothetical protein